MAEELERLVATLEVDDSLNDLVTSAWVGHLSGLQDSRPFAAS